MAKLRKVDLYDAHNQLVSRKIKTDAAANKMRISHDSLVAFIAQDGYCLVNTPKVLMAVWSETPVS